MFNVANITTAIAKRWLNKHIHFSAHIATDAVIGEHVKIGRHVSIGSDVVIADYVEIEDEAVIHESVHIGQDSHLGFGCEIGFASKLEANVDIQHGVHIGKHNLIGRNSVFETTSETADHVIIGRDCHLSGHVAENSKVAQQVQLYYGANIGKDCLIKRGCKINSSIRDQSRIESEYCSN